MFVPKKKLLSLFLLGLMILAASCSNPVTDDKDGSSNNTGPYDARLENIYFNSSATTLSTAFDPDLNSYVARTSYEYITIIPVAIDNDCPIHYCVDSGNWISVMDNVSSGIIHLLPGSTLVQLKISSPDENTSNIYDIRVVREIGVTRTGAIAQDTVKDMIIDRHQNIYITGTCYYDMENLLHTYNESFSDSYIIKMNKDREVIWTRGINSMDNENATAMTVNSAGQLYITGSTDGDLDGETNQGQYDIFLTLFQTNGERIATRLFGTTESDICNDIAKDSQDYIYLVGGTYGDLNGETNLDGNAAFIIKCNETGYNWTRLIDTTSDQEAKTITIDKDDNIYVAGSTSQELDGQPYAGGSSEVFITKFDTAGTKLWTRLFGSTESEYVTDIITDDEGYIYITGGIRSEIDGQPFAGIQDIFIAKYSPEGVRIWTRLLGNDQFDFSSKITLSQDNQLYIVGYTKSDLSSQTHSNTGYNETIVAKYNTSGEIQWVRLIGSLTSDISFNTGRTIATDQDNNLILSGTINAVDDPLGDIFLTGIDPYGYWF